MRCQDGDHHLVVDDLKLYFWFLAIVRVKGVLFLVRFFDALFLYFG